MELLWIVLAPMLLAVAAPFLVRFLPRAAGWLLAIVPAGVFAALARHHGAIVIGDPLQQAIPWIDPLGIHLAFNLDGFSLLFALLISGIGTLVVIYAGGYLHSDRDLGRFFVYLLLFMGSMLGVVLADDVITLFIFWELTSLTSFFLIGYYHEDPVSRRNAMQAMLVTAAGGLALLAGLLLLADAAGTMRLSEILTMGDTIREHPHYTAILVLVIAGAFTKSAQFPFHYWHPNAMAAPTPVSAYLHSATMVKAGVYLLARLHPVLGGTDPWFYALVIAGGITMLLGAYLAFRHTDFKLVLAYTTVSALGTLVLLIGIGTDQAMKAAMVFLLAHALYKGGYFLIAGAVDHSSGTRDITRLGGLAKAMPLTATAAVLVGLSLSGILPTFAFIAKEAMLEATLHAPLHQVGVTLAIAVTSVLFVAIAARTAYRPFFGPPTDTPKTPHEAPPALLISPLLLAVIGFVIGLLPKVSPQALLTRATINVYGESVPAFHLVLWHGITLPLLISIAIILLGIVLYRLRDAAARQTVRFDPLVRWGPEANYHRMVQGLLHLATRLTRTIQTTHIRHYFIVILLGGGLAIAFTFLYRHGIPHAPTFTSVPIHEAVVLLMVMGGAVFTATARSRLTAVIALGLVGYGIALLFILFGAPDLALTQFLFETLIVLLFTFVLIRMPVFTKRSRPGARTRDIALGAFVGILMAGLVWTITATDFHPPISEYFAENSYILAHGRNVVNVILVDFRGLDTLGEIVVIAVAAVGAYALMSMRERRRRNTPADTEGEP